MELETMTMGVFYGVIEQPTALFHVEQAPGKTSGGLFEKRRKKKKKEKSKNKNWTYRTPKRRSP